MIITVLNDESMNVNDEHMTDLVIDNLKRKLSNGTDGGVQENEFTMKTEGVLG